MELLDPYKFNLHITLGDHGHSINCGHCTARPQRVGADALFAFHVDETMLKLCGGRGGGGVGEYSTPLTLLFTATKPHMHDLT